MTVLDTTTINDLEPSPYPADALPPCPLEPMQIILARVMQGGHESVGLDELSATLSHLQAAALRGVGTDADPVVYTAGSPEDRIAQLGLIIVSGAQGIPSQKIGNERLVFGTSTKTLDGRPYDFVIERWRNGNQVTYSFLGSVANAEQGLQP